MTTADGRSPAARPAQGGGGCQSRLDFTNFTPSGQQHIVSSDNQYQLPKATSGDPKLTRTQAHRHVENAQLQHFNKQTNGNSLSETSNTNLLTRTKHDIKDYSDHYAASKQVDAEEEEEEEESLSEVLLNVASAEEYAAKIVKIQQACLVPLKEDLADWLNKILKTSDITTRNFMDTLDNGVIICRLAKIISLWCEQQLTSEHNTEPSAIDKQIIAEAENYEPPKARPRATRFAHSNGPLRSLTSQSAHCLASVSATSLNINGHPTSNSRFLNNLHKMHQTKIWEDAKCRTFYARDNVCHFIEWSKEFGVNQSILFESDDLVLHANPRQVVLCLLDVARIAYVKYAFTEAPGLVKFEQEIGKGLSTGLDSRVKSTHSLNDDGFVFRNNAQAGGIPPCGDNHVPNHAGKSLGVSIGDATDELILRYCRHKEEEAARKKLESSASISEQRDIDEEPTNEKSLDNREYSENEAGSMNCGELLIEESKNLTHTRSSDFTHADSLDSGEGPTESASTGHSCRGIGNLTNDPEQAIDCDVLTPPQTPSKRASLSPSPMDSHQTCSLTDSEVSSSRSSLLSNDEGKSIERPITSDLDGKVMRIAKSYYGKGATKDVKRLSEGKYKIADRIVFVRLLKGHRVMVRIGGGWDTLENFLFRHKSDPSQVIDVDHLLPIETKMSLEKTPQVTPTRVQTTSKLPYYRRSNSASSTNLSLSNLSLSNHSITSTPSSREPKLTATSASPGYNGANSVESTPTNLRKQQIPFLLIHKNHTGNLKSRLPKSSLRDFNDRTLATQLPKPQSGSMSHLRQPIYHNKANSGRLNVLQRPLASSTAPSVSTNNLYPATLISRYGASATKTIRARELLNNSTNNLHYDKSNTDGKHEPHSRIRRPSDSLLNNSTHKSTNSGRATRLNNGLTTARVTGATSDCK